MSASSRRICDGPPRPAAPKSGRCNDRPYHQRGWSGHHSCTSRADTANVTPYKNSRQAHEYWSPRVPTPPPGLRPAAVALRAAQNSGLAFSSDRRAPDTLRQSADGCALWSRLETRYLRLPSPLRNNIFRQTRAPFGPHSDEDLRWRPGAPQACHFASVIANNLSIGNPQVASRPRPSDAAGAAAGRRVVARRQETKIVKCPC